MRHVLQKTAHTPLILLIVLLVAPISTLAKTPQRAKKPATLTGTYTLNFRKGAGGTLQVRQFSPNRIEFDLDFNRGAPSYNMGFAHGTIEVNNGIAVYRVTEYNGPCEIRFDFRANVVNIKQNGDDFACGFGHGVDCSGAYRLVSHKP